MPRRDPTVRASAAGQGCVRGSSYGCITRRDRPRVAIAGRSSRRRGRLERSSVAVVPPSTSSAQTPYLAGARPASRLWMRRHESRRRSYILAMTDPGTSGSRRFSRELAELEAFNRAVADGLELRSERTAGASVVYSIRLDRGELRALERRALVAGIKPTVLARNLIRVGLSTPVAVSTSPTPSNGSLSRSRSCGRWSARRRCCPTSVDERDRSARLPSSDVLTVGVPGPAGRRARARARARGGRRRTRRRCAGRTSSRRSTASCCRAANRRPSSNWPGSSICSSRCARRSAPGCRCTARARA